MRQQGELSKVQILINQKRFAEAKKLLNDLMASNPRDVYFLFLLSEILLHEEDYDGAEKIVNRAISIAPDTDYLFHLKSRIHLAAEAYQEAEQNADLAIQLDPNDDDNLALMAHIKLLRKKFDEALHYADLSLAVDSENLLALNVRSTALLKLDRKTESFETIQGALREDPHNTYTHANLGWGLLENGDHKQALIHFQESLKKDPDNDYARSGMLEAIKASNPFYRMFLKYAFWMSNMDSQKQWAVIIGFYFGFKFLNGIAANNEGLQFILYPLLTIVAILAFSTWIIGPVSNLFLRFNKYGKILLDKEQRISSNFVGASLLICLAGVVSYYLTGREPFLALGIFGFAMMVPLGMMFTPSKYKNGFIYVALAMAALGLYSVFSAFAQDLIFTSASTIFILAFVAFQWGANFLMIQRDNR